MNYYHLFIIPSLLFPLLPPTHPKIQQNQLPQQPPQQQPLQDLPLLIQSFPVENYLYPFHLLLSITILLSPSLLFITPMPHLSTNIIHPLLPIMQTRRYHHFMILFMMAMDFSELGDQNLAGILMYERLCMVLLPVLFLLPTLLLLSVLHHPYPGVIPLSLLMSLLLHLPLFVVVPLNLRMYVLLFCY